MVVVVVVVVVLVVVVDVVVVDVVVVEVVVVVVAGKLSQESPVRKDPHTAAQAVWQVAQSPSMLRLPFEQRQSHEASANIAHHNSRQSMEHRVIQPRGGVIVKFLCSPARERQKIQSDQSNCRVCVAVLAFNTSGLWTTESQTSTRAHRPRRNHTNAWSNTR